MINASSLNDSWPSLDLGPLQDREQAVARLSVANWMGWQDSTPASLLPDASTWARSPGALPVSWRRLAHPDRLPFRCAQFSGHPPSWSPRAPLRRQQTAQNPRPAEAYRRSILRTQPRRRARALSLADAPW